MNNVSKVVDKGLCTSCGICAGACKKNCISFLYGHERNTPIVDETVCINCGLCYDVCPGKGIQLNHLSENLFGGETGINKDLYTGYYQSCYVGHSTDGKIRMHSATGGMVTQFLIWLLEKNYIDGAVVVRYRHDNPFEPEPIIATTKEEIWESRSSKYVILSMDKVAAQISNIHGKRIVVVGLPCQIQGWRQLAKRNETVRNAIVGYFAIYCSVNKTKHSMSYYPWRYKVDPKNVGHFAFRDDGCMGFMKFSDKEGKEIRKIPYLSFWFGTHSFFINPRCLLCIDQLGELADVSFGDIHIKPYSDDLIGTNSIVSRSNGWDRLLHECKAEGFIMLEEIPIGTLVQSQTYTKTFKKGAGVKTNFILRGLIGKSNPVYDYYFPGRIGLQNILTEIGKVIMRTIGRHRSLWFVIKLLDRS